MFPIQISFSLFMENKIWKGENNYDYELRNSEWLASACSNTSDSLIH